MKICYVSKGINIHDQKFLRHLGSRSEYDVHLLSFYGGTLPKIEGVKVHRISLPRPKISFSIASVITRILIKKIKPDIVHGNYLLTYGFYSAFANYHPLLQMAWGSDVLKAPKNRVFRYIIKYSLKRADFVTVDCEFGKNAIINLGYPEDKIAVFPWGVDLNKFNYIINGENIRKELGWENNSIIVCTRKHEPVYGMEYLIRAIPEVIKKEDNARFIVIGSGSLTNKLKQMVKNLNIEGYVKFTGNVPNDILGKYLAASDIYVSSSLSDGTSVSLLEAMACGLPVVVTDVDAILEWVKDGENGFVVPKRNSLALAEKICELLEDGNLRKTFGKKNYRIAKERASWDDNVKVLEDIYQMLARD